MVSPSGADASDWLDRNAIRCERYRSRISPLTCERYQIQDPVNCKGCVRVAVPEAPAEKLPGWVRGLRVRNDARKAENMADRKPVRKCSRCGEVKVIQVRGVCSACYYHVRKEEGRPIPGRGMPSATTVKAAAEKPPVESVAAPIARVEKAPPCTMTPLPSPDVISFLFRDEDALLEKVTALARKDRRDVRSEVLCILEAYFEGAA